MFNWELLHINLGDVKDAFLALNEMNNLDYMIQLLGQSPINKNEDLLIPFHKHHDIKMVKEIYLICCMLLDARMEILDKNNVKRRPISKYYAHILYQFSNSLSIPSKDTLEGRIYNASRNLVVGDWRGCYKIMREVKSTDDIPYLEKNIKLIALGGFIMSNQEYINKLSIEDLSNEFGVPVERVIGTLEQLKN